MAPFAKTVPVLMFHHVSSAPGMITVSPAHFADQMAYLAESGYRTVDAAQLAAFLNGAPLPAKSIVITFDDGYLDNWVHAHPVLLQYGFSALCFLVTSWIGDGPVRGHAGSDMPLPMLLNHHEGEGAIDAGNADQAILRWSEIDAMRAAGTFEFHSHTHRHIRWDLSTADRDAKCAGLQSDLSAARGALQAHFGQCSDHLCWPQGYYDADYQRIAAELGFRFFYTCEMGANVPTSTAAQCPRSLFRLEVRDRPSSWLASRLWVHSRPWISRAYLKIKR